MLHGPRSTQRKAKALRASLTLPEVLLWQALRTRPGGLKFRRQHPAGRYVLDFFCASLQLAVEIDGEVHGFGDRAQGDEERDAWLRAQGVRVLRVPASDVLADVDHVVDHILAEAAAIADAPPLHHAMHGPPPLAGED